MALEMASHWSSAVTQRPDWSGAHPRHSQNAAVAEESLGPPLSLTLRSTLSLKSTLEIKATRVQQAGYLI